MNWLENLTKEKIENGNFPLSDVLENSFYYPACGFDGGIVKDCNTMGRDLNIFSFVYCDYDTGEQAFRHKQDSFLGYHVLGSRSVSQSELIPNGWQPQFPPNFNLQDYHRYRYAWKPFINWTVYERDDNRDDSHGRTRFSLLYIGGEGVATYQALYWSNNISPRAIAIIRPGTGFGGNWTDFKDGNGALAWVVNNNPAGQPEFIYIEGNGNGTSGFNWNGYIQSIINRLYNIGVGELEIWTKQIPE